MTYMDNVRDLELLTMLARYGSFTDVALEAGISQPAVSQAIRRLEKRLGTRLVQRQRFGAGDGTQLTQAGRTVVDHVGQALDLINSLPEALAARTGIRRRTIGLPPIISSLLSSGQGQQKQSEPDKNTTVETIGSQKLLGQIEAHRVDYGAVASVDESLSVDGVETTKLASYPFGMVCTQSMAERLGTAGMTSLHPEDLAMLPGDVPFATLNRDFVHAQAAERLIHLSEPVSHLIEVSDVETLKLVTTSGLVCSLITSAGVHPGDGLHFIPFAGDDMPRFNIFLFNDTKREAFHEDVEEVHAFSDYATSRLGSVA